MSHSSPATEPTPPFRFRYPLRVRFAETDAQGVVFNANYWVYMDTAIVEYCRALGQDYLDMRAGGVDFTLAESKCRLTAGAVFDEPLAVHVRTVHLGRTSWVVEFQITSEHDARTIARAQNGYVFISPEDGSKIPVPDEFRRAVLAYEGPFQPPTTLTPLLDSLSTLPGD